MPDTRAAMISPTAPVEAPTSAMHSPGCTCAKAASRTASVPARCPRRGCSNRTRPPSRLSSDGPSGSGIPQLGLEPRLDDDPPCACGLIVRAHDAPGEGAHRALERADVPVGDEHRNPRRLEDRLD